MSRFFLTSVFIFIFIITYSQEERKTQLWNYNSVSVQVGDKTSIEVVDKIHYSTEESNINLKFGDLWLKHKINNWFEYGGGIRVVRAKNKLGWVKENRPMVIATFYKQYKKIDFTFSSRFAYRFIENEDNFFSHRQKFDIDFPAVSRLKLRFFTAEESFLNMNDGSTNLARFYAGINTVKREHFQIKVYYSLEKNKDLHAWNTVDILGVNMNIWL